MSWASRVARAYSTCSRCCSRGKPYLEHRVYELYAPEKLRVLVVSESPPPGATHSFLYNTSHPDRLRRLLSRVLGVEEWRVPEELRRAGVFWTTAVKCRPPNRRSLEKMADNCAVLLALELEAKPEKVVLLGRLAQKVYEKAVTLYTGEIVWSVYREKHPLYVQRFERSRLEDYIAWLRKLLTARG